MGYGDPGRISRAGSEQNVGLLYTFGAAPHETPPSTPSIYIPNMLATRGLKESTQHPAKSACGLLDEHIT